MPNIPRGTTRWQPSVDPFGGATRPKVGHCLRKLRPGARRNPNSPKQRSIGESKGAPSPPGSILQNLETAGVPGYLRRTEPMSSSKIGLSSWDQMRFGIGANSGINPINWIVRDVKCRENQSYCSDFEQRQVPFSPKDNRRMRNGGYCGTPRSLSRRCADAPGAKTKLGLGPKKNGRALQLKIPQLFFAQLPPSLSHNELFCQQTALSKKLLHC